MLRDECLDFRNGGFIVRRRKRSNLEWKLAGSVHVDEEYFGGMHRQIMAEVFLNQVDHQIEERGCPAASNNVALVDNHVAFLQVNSRKSPFEFVREKPMSRRPFSVQHTAGAQNERSCAETGEVCSPPE